MVIINDGLALVLSKFDGVRRSAGAYLARCPAHADNNPSLSISEGDKHPVVMTCHAGCDRDAILAALGLTWEDVCSPRERSDKPQIVATYPYVDEAGELLFEVVRFFPKGFRQRRPDGTGGWLWNLKGVRRVLYRLPEVLAAVADGLTVFVTEGEKDADVLAADGVCATTCPQGAGKWRAEYAETLRGADVVVVADRDEPGRKHAAEVARTLDGVAAEVRVVESLAGKDAADHLAAGHTVEEFARVDAELSPSGLRVLSRADLDGIPPPEWLVEGMFTTGLTVLYGPSNKGKSFVALDWSCHVATGSRWFTRQCSRRRVLYVAAEGTSGIPRRVRAWEQDRRLRADDFWLVPQVVNLLDGAARDAIGSELEHRRVGLLVVDTFARSMPGGDENSAQDVGMIVHALTTMQEATGCAVLVIHHTGVEGKRPRGSTALYGAADTVIRCDGEPGVVRVLCEKQKDDEAFSSWELRLKPVGESVVLSTRADGATPDDRVAAVERLLAGGRAVSHAELCRAGGFDVVAQMNSAGRIVQVDEDGVRRYRLGDGTGTEELFA